MSAGHLELGRLIIISGPSGSGKSTLTARLFQICEVPLVQSVSATTRRPRPGELDGEHYHFLTPDEFQRLRDQGEFIECCEVHHNGDWYGTLRREVEPRIQTGSWVVLEIDVEGTLAVLKNYPQATTFFVRLNSVEELEQRLRRRGTESEAGLQLRLENARRELQLADFYKYQIINDDLERAAREICKLLMSQGETSPC